MPQLTMFKCVRCTRSTDPQETTTVPRDWMVLNEMRSARVYHYCPTCAEDFHKFNLYQIHYPRTGGT